MDIKSSERGKTRRKKIRPARKGLVVKEKENEPSEFIYCWRSLELFLLFYYV